MALPSLLFSIGRWKGKLMTTRIGDGPLGTR
jgi:hypothetical protein